MLDVSLMSSLTYSDIVANIIPDKAGHGFLGTIGGAIVGSLAEDYAKKGKKQKKHHNGRRDASVSGQSANGLSGMASSFFNQKR